MTYARGNKHSLKVARSRMETVLEPIHTAMSYITGADRPFLVRGLGYHRVVGNLAARLPELRTCFEISDKSKSRRAHISLAYGAVIAVLISFTVLSSEPLASRPATPCTPAACSARSTPRSVAPSPAYFMAADSRS